MRINIKDFNPKLLVSPALLVLVVYIVKIQLLKHVLRGGVDLAQAVAVAGCSAADTISQTALSVPGQMASTANKLISSSIDNTVQGLLDSMELVVTLIQNLVLFVLEMTVGTYACLTISLVGIAASEALNATESVINVANTTIQEAVVDLGKGLGKLSDLINDAEGLIDDVTEFVTGGSTDLKNVNLTVGRLRNFTISSDIDTKLDHLRSNIPTYNSTRTKVENLIKQPFNAIRGEITAQNTTDLVHVKLIGPPTSANSSTPACNQEAMARDFNILRKDITMASDIVCILCGVGMILFLLYSHWRSISRWKTYNTEKSSNKDQNIHVFKNDPAVSNVWAVTRDRTPWVERKLVSFVAKHTVPGYQRYMWQWYIRWILDRPLLGVLVLGLIGVAITIAEYAIYRVFVDGARLAKRETKIAIQNIDNIVNAEFGSWRNSTNTQIAQTESAVNTNVLGWIETGSQSVNKSLNTFMSSINSEINSVFNGTILQKPLAAVIDCVIGNKVTEVEEALTWIHNNAQVHLPRIPDDILQLNGSISSSTADITNNGTSTAPSSSLGSEAMDVLDSVAASLKHQLSVQGGISGALIAIWLLFAIGALIYLIQQLKAVEQSSVPVKDSPRSSITLRTISTDSDVLSRYSTQPSVHSMLTTDTIRSPQAIFNRVTRFFSGPSRRLEMIKVSAPVLHQLPMPNLDMDSPKTPLQTSFPPNS